MASIHDFHTHNFLFGIATRNDQVEVIKWFFSPERVTLMGATLAWVLCDIGHSAMVTESWCGLESLEIVLSSAVFREVLTTTEQQALLRKLLFKLERRPCVAARNLLIAHGAQVNTNDSNHSNYPPVLTMEVLDLLVDNGACIIGTDMLSTTSYIAACDVARRLLQLGAIGSYNAGVMRVARAQDRVDVVQVLLECAFIDVNDESESDPISEALFS